MIIDEQNSRPDSDISPNNTISTASVSDKSKTVDQGMSLPLALLGRAEIFMALKEHHFALEDLRLAAEHDLPDKSM